jgi:hypothetical protein
MPYATPVDDEEITDELIAEVERMGREHGCCGDAAFAPNWGRLDGRLVLYDYANLPEPVHEPPIILWHGSQSWRGTPDVQPAAGDRLEHGPGIYLTTSYRRARSYARGGGSVIRFEIDPHVRWLEHETLPLADAIRFLEERPRLRKRAETIADLRENAARTAGRLGGDRVRASVLVNLMVNYRSATGDHGPALARFLAAHGIGASLANELAGEDWVLVFDPRAILAWRKVPAGEVDELKADAPLVRTRVRGTPVGAGP